MAETVAVAGLGAAATDYSNLTFGGAPLSPRATGRKRDGALADPAALALRADAAVGFHMRDDQRVDGAAVQAGKSAAEFGGGAAKAACQRDFSEEIRDDVMRIEFAAVLAGARANAAQGAFERAELRIDLAFEHRVFLRHMRTRRLPPMCTSTVHLVDVGSENVCSRGAAASACNLICEIELF